MTTNADIFNKLLSLERKINEIHKAIAFPVYLVNTELVDLASTKSLIKKLSGKKQPGTIIHLTKEEMRLYRTIEICPPPKR